MKRIFLSKTTCNKQFMANKEPGYVYILTNPSFREDWVKIGMSSRPVDVRSKELRRPWTTCKIK